MLFRAQLDEFDRVAFGNFGQQSVPVIVLAVVVPAFLVHGHEAGFDQYRPVGAQAVPFRRVAGCEVDGNSVEDGGHHLAGHGAPPDQRVQLVLLVVQRTPDVVGMARGRRGSNGFVRLLGVLRLILERAHFVGHVLGAVALGDDVANFGNRDFGQRD